MFHVVIIGEPLAYLAEALHRAEIKGSALTTAQALRHPGLLTDADLSLLLWSPGEAPMVESHVFTAQLGALHLAGDHETVEVGPFVGYGVGPCPHCLTRTERFSPPITPPLAAWAAAFAALQVMSLYEHGATDLVGRSYRWCLANPGLEERLWYRDDSCQRPGCVNPPLP